MWKRMTQSEVVVRRNMLPDRIVLDRDSVPNLPGSHRQELSLNGRIFRDPALAIEKFERRKQMRSHYSRWPIVITIRG